MSLSSRPLLALVALLPLTACVDRAKADEKLSRACAAFRKLPVEATARLKPGLMWFWSSRWQQIERSWEVPEGRPILVATRPRLSRHGGT